MEDILPHPVLGEYSNYKCLPTCCQTAREKPFLVIIWILKLCRLVGAYRRFGRNNCTFFILRPSASLNIKVSFDNKMVRNGQGHILAKERQCTYRVTLTSVRVTTIVLEKY